MMNQTMTDPAALRKIPLCVDLDGTLLATDLLWESILALARQKPHFVLFLPFWLLRGKAFVKREIAKRTRLDFASLPFQADVLEYLREEKEAGREIVLVTASDRLLAKEVAAHVQCFSEVIASDGGANLKGTKKLEAIRKRYGFKQFDYIGNSASDLPVWQAANSALLVQPATGLLSKVSRTAKVAKVFGGKKVGFSAILFKMLRIHQWSKNMLMFLPLIFIHKIADERLMFKTILAFLIFSLCASGAYCLNDLMDIQDDRRHPRKKYRAFAAGFFPIPYGVMLIPLLFLCAFLMSAIFLPYSFSLVLIAYLISTIAYTLYFKKAPVIDILMLAGLYTIRIFAGGMATGTPISTWLLAFSMFFFLSLAFVKRYSEFNMPHMREEGKHVSARAYRHGDLHWLAGMGTASGYMSVLVFALYINSREVVPLYRHPETLWLICPLLLYWIARIWFLAHREKLHDDPVVATLKDPLSYGLGAAIGLILLAAA